jgi:glycosyltransferase involved in cell wall biosynthesis
VRILVLHRYVPFPVDHGGSMRSHEIISALVAEHDVSFVSLGDAEDGSVADWPLARSFRDPPVVVTESPDVPITRRGRALRRLAPRPLLGRPASVRSSDRPAFWNAVAELPLDEYDAVQSKDLHLVPFLVAVGRRYPHLALVLDLDDVQSHARRDRLRTWPRLRASRLRVWLDYRRLAAYERRYLPLLDSVWVCKPEDVVLLRASVGLSRLECVPNVVDTAALHGISRPAHPPRLLFVGQFGVTHNDDAVDWLLDEIWPRVRTRAPHAELWLVGKHPTARVLAASSSTAGVHVAGDVPDVRPYLAAATLSIVPIRFGSGTRLKVLESMAAGVPVVATSIGASGLGAEDGVHCRIADRAEELADACADLLADSRRREALAHAAARLVAERFDTSVTAGRVSAVYRRLPARKAAPTTELS